MQKDLRRLKKDNTVFKQLLCTLYLSLCITQSALAYEAHEKNIDFFMDLIEADRYGYCKVFCHLPLCKATPFQTFCENNCENYVKEEIFDKCLAQKSVSIPPLHVLTSAAMGAEGGSALGWGMPFGGGTTAATSWLLGDAARLPAGIVGLPGYLLGGVLGAIAGGLRGSAIAATEGALLGFCYGMCHEKSCRKYPKLKGFCKEVCANGREFSIKKCIATEETTLGK